MMALIATGDSDNSTVEKEAMDIIKFDNNKPLSRTCHTELQADYGVTQENTFQIHDTSDQCFPSLEHLTQHLNEGILISSDVTLDEESQFDTGNDGGLLLVWGCGEFGQHGHGHQNDVAITAGITNPVIIGQDGLVTLIACGSSHSVVVTDDNRIFSWGNCNSGQLGIGDTKTTLQPHLVQLGIRPGTRIRGVECGTRHTFVWTEEGDCFSFGNNFSAQLGYDFRKPDFKQNQLQPVYLETLFNQKIQQVACGSRHSVFLFTSGSVASVGSNDRGQLGHSDRTDSVCIQKVVDVQNVSIIGCGNCHSLAADRDGNVYAWGYGKACGCKEDILSPTAVYKADSTGVTGLVGGDSHSLLLLGNGKLMSWGNNFEGQLGQGKTVKFVSKPTELKEELLRENIVNISVGENTSAAVTEEGRLFMWGKNVSQVICEDEGPRYCQYDPHPVPLGKWRATKVSCGAWHVACIVAPDEKPNTWDWTPPLVNMPGVPGNPFEAEKCCEDVLDDESNWYIMEETSVNDVFKEAEGHTMDSDRKMIVSHENNENAILEPVQVLKKEIPLSKHDMNSKKLCGIMESNKELTDNKDKEVNPVEFVKNKEGCHQGVIKESPEVTDDQQITDKRHPYLKMDKPAAFNGSKKKKSSTCPKEKNNLQKAASEESINSYAKQLTKPCHISKSLCNIEVEKSDCDGESSPERRSSTGMIRSTSRIHSRSLLTTGKHLKSTESLISTSTSATVDASQNNTGQVNSRVSFIGTWNPPLSPGGGGTGQLNREKKAPRHLRRVPSVPKMEYYLPNQPTQSADVRENFSKQKYDQRSTINRVQSSPNIISNHQSEIHPITLNMPSTPLGGMHIPHPPQADGLPPRHPRFKKLSSSQKLVFSSGSSWRKRNSKI